MRLNMVSITNNLPTSVLINSKQVGNLDSLLKVGQVITANIQPIKADQVKLTIGNQTLLASTKQPINENGQIQLKVKQTTPDLQLAIVSNKPESSSKIMQQSIQAIYRQFIPSQAPLSQTFQQISLLQSLPPSLNAPIQQLLSQVGKSVQQLDGAELKQKLINSGLFFESKLKGGIDKSAVSQLKNDLKAQVLQLQQQVNALQHQTPSTSLNKLAGLLNQALSRLTVQQVQLIENPNITPLELPLQMSNQVVENRIEIRKAQQDEQTVWEAYLDVALPLGQLSSKLKLVNNEQMHCFLWCETDTLQKEVQQKLETLQQLLNQDGLHQTSIQIVPQKPQKSKNSTQVTLIDITV